VDCTDRAFQLELVLLRQLDQFLRRSRAAVARNAIRRRAQRAHRFDRRQPLQVGRAVGQIGLELQLRCGWRRAPTISATPACPAPRPALVDNRQPVAEAVGFVHVMRGEKQRAALLARRCVIISHTEMREAGSRPVVGSSRNRIADRAPGRARFRGAAACRPTAWKPGRWRGRSGRPPRAVPPCARGAAPR
jgi:hypothetical protein